MGHHIVRTMIKAGAIIAVSTGIASAQSGLNLLGPSGHRMTQEEHDKQEAIDQAYKSAIKKMPDKPKSVDPWGSVRPNTSSPQSK